MHMSCVCKIAVVDGDLRGKGITRQQPPNKPSTSNKRNLPQHLGTRKHLRRNLAVEWPSTSNAVRSMKWNCVDTQHMSNVFEKQVCARCLSLALCLPHDARDLVGARQCATSAADSSTSSSAALAPAISLPASASAVPTSTPTPTPTPTPGRESTCSGL